MSLTKVISKLYCSLKSSYENCKRYLLYEKNIDDSLGTLKNTIDNYAPVATQGY